MRYIKSFEDKKLEYIGKLYKIYPTRKSSEMIVIAKLINLLGINNTWGDFQGYFIYPESKKGQKWSDSEYLSDWMNSIPTDEEKSLYEFYDKSAKYNL